jgi:two-component system sensor kinase FixL
MQRFLRQLMAGSRLVAGAMSHEIRNVCAAIGIVHLNLLRSGLITANKDFEALGGLVHTLEDLAAVELSYAAPKSSEVDLVAVLNDLRVVISPRLHELNVETAWAFAEELPKAWADRSQLMQIFLNLSSNSVRALSNVTSPQFSVAARAEQGKLVVEFTDNGGGIRDCEKLFHPFQQAAVASGLGLYLSRAFACSMGGDLQYRPLPGHACFVLELLSAERQGQVDG